MHTFTCFRCGKNFKRKDYLSKHLKRKFQCKKIDNPVENLNLNQEKKKDVIQCYPKLSKIIQNYPKLPSSNISSSQIVKYTKNDNKTGYKCKYCFKIYKYRSGLSKHISNLKCKEISQKMRKNIIKTYKNKKILEIKTDLENKSLILKKKFNNQNENEIKSGNKNKHNIINNNCITSNTINNTNNTLVINHINPFGQENLESISEDTILKILNRRFNSFQTAIKTIHKDIPQNCNFFLPNKSNRKYITYFNGKDCVYETSTKFKDKLSGKIMKQLEEWFIKYNKKFIKRQRTVLKKVFNEYYDGKLEERYNTEIDKFLLSHSNEIKNIIANTLQTL